MSRPRRSLFRQAGPFKVVSQLGGLLVITPSYDGRVPEGCRLKVQRDGGDEGRNWCPSCQCNHIFGFMGRMALAGDIEEMLNRLARHVTKKKPPSLGDRDA